MSFLVDLIILAVIFLFTFLGYKRGLIKVAIKLFTFFIAIILAFVFYKPVANIVIEKTNIDESIQTAIVSHILPDGTSENDELDLTSIDLPKIILNNCQNTVQSIATSCSTKLIETACLLLLFIVIKIVLKFVTILADLIAKLPILKQFNKLGGTIYGILEGIFIVFAGFAVLTFISPLLDPALVSAIDSSTLGNICYNNNLLLNFIL